MPQIVLIALTALTRFAFRSHYLYDIDSVNFALALKRFDPSAHQPHPPGYFLYVCLGRLVNLIFHDANAALVAISIAFSCGAAALIYVLADNWFGRKAALFAGMIFVFSPLGWFHGTVALTYIVEAFFSTLIGYLCWRIYCGGAGFIVPGAIVAGIAAGFRPSSLLLLGPLLLFSMYKSNRKQIAYGMATLFGTLLAWFIPMIGINGAAGLYIVAGFTMAYRTREDNGFQFLDIEFGRTRRYDCRHLWALFRLRRDTSIPGKERERRRWPRPG